MLVALAGVSLVLLLRLDAATNRFVRDYSSMPALQEARAALLGYAVSYADTHPGHGPGFLPCPDRDNDGATDGGSCALAPNATTMGRLPYETLEIPRVMDHAGEVLWYALADNYRNNPKGVLNSDTPGNFTVDARDDIVAVVFAPGPPLAAQSRGTAAEQRDVSNYLEGDNADKNARFVTQAGALQDGHDQDTFNDRLLVITRQELMQAVEKRVLGEVARALTDYQKNNGAYPWLSPFVAPQASSFRGQAGQRQGHLAYHDSGRPPKPGEQTQALLAKCLAALSEHEPSVKGAFLTRLALSWRDFDLREVQVRRQVRKDGRPVQAPGIYGRALLSDACLRNSRDCDAGLSPLVAPDMVECRWPDAQTCPQLDPRAYQDIVSCRKISAVVRRPQVSYSDKNEDGYCQAGRVSRVFTIEFPSYFAGTATIRPPRADAVRVRDVSLTAASSDQVLSSSGEYHVFIADAFSGELYNRKTKTCDKGEFHISALMYFDPQRMTRGRITVHNIHYDLDLGRGELPAWLMRNGWQNLIYVAYASAEPLPGSSAEADCASAAASCLTVNVHGTDRTDVRAIVLSAGAGLNRSGPGESLTDYLEGDNGNLDHRFEKKRITANYNDQIRIIAPAP